MPDLSPYIAVGAFILGGLFNAIVSAATAEYRARQDHRRAGEIDKRSRSRSTATALLEDFDRIAELFSWRTRGSHKQPDIEPLRRAIRRRAVEFEDVRIRQIVEEITDIFYYNSDDAEFGETSTSALVRYLLESARQVLGSVIREEPFTDPPEMAVPRRVAKQASDYYTEQYEEEMAYERALKKTGTTQRAEIRQLAQRDADTPNVSASESPSEGS